MQSKKIIELLILIPLSIWVGMQALRGYFFPNINLLLFFLFMPIAFRSQKKAIGNIRFLLIATFLLAIYWFIQVKILLLLGIGSLVLGIWEYLVGRLTWLPFGILVVLSPTLHYFLSVFTFPIRLTLSNWAGKIISLVDKSVICKGNYFELNDGFIFTVDTACVGLNMMATGLSLTLLLVGFEYRRTAKILPFWVIIILLSSTFVLLIFANLLRIIALVLFRWLPNTMAHDLIGIIALFLYVLLPMYFLTTFVQKKWAFTPSNNPISKILPITYFRIWVIFLLFAFYQIENFAPPQYPEDLKTKNLQMEGFQKETLKSKVISFTNETTIVYIKPPTLRWGSDHTPLFCWKASGYIFEKIENIKIGNYEILKATLQQDTAKLYTAWWYDNGANKTVSQWRWRTDWGEPYRLINVTTTQEQLLLPTCEQFLKLKMF